MKIEKLLIIEDDSVTNLITRELLVLSESVLSYEIKTNGIVALDFLDNCHQKAEFPDVIFLDLYMPACSGFDFLQTYQEKYFALYPDTKVVVLTNSYTQSDLTKVLKFNCVFNYFLKPFTPFLISQLLAGNPLRV
jgi:CheY-like chemotaxis protein